MAQQTEALCLLQSGASYVARSGLEPLEGDTIFAGFKAGAFSLYFGDEPIYHFDLDGRWQRAFIGGIHYRKGFDTRVQAIERIREGVNLVLRRRTLSEEEARDIDAGIRAAAMDLASATSAGLRWLDPPPSARPLSPEELREFLERVSRWDAAAYLAQRELFTSLYRRERLTFPEAAQSVLLQPSFDGSVALSEFAEQRFAAHASRVAALWGRRLVQAKTALLDADGMWRLPVEAIVRMFQVASRTFPLRGSPPIDSSAATHVLDGVIGFLDDFHPNLPDVPSWRTLAGHGLSRMILSIASADPDVRSLRGQTWCDEDLRELVAKLSQADVAMSVVLWLGTGGHENADREFERATALIPSLDLPNGALVYLVDSREAVGDATAELLESRGLTPVRGSEYESLVARYRTRLASLRIERGVKVAPYSLEKQGT
jgi:hypothetical protein